MNKNINISKEIKQYLKDTTEGLYEIVGLSRIDSCAQRLTYIKFSQYGTKAPDFTVRSKEVNINHLIRDQFITNLLDSGNESGSYFDVEELIFDTDSRKKIDQLRNGYKLNLNSHSALEGAKVKWSQSFHIGQKVYYNGLSGIITFKHSNKGKDEIIRWSVKSGNTEWRYIDGTRIIPRKEYNLSNIEIDPILNKLSTEKLLKIYKSRRKRNKGMGDLKIKRILQDREHVQVGDIKVVIVNK